ncbi:hypothetical protein [Lactobacillus delbrueckii]|uniref:hypothetical protein n=1 Tax=Lactobacillus delbrueckii TaxID=1584 RepID=UPI001E403ED9|nr:hypothetical protein [Lactobacillus delbrueckii]MCD5532685.1 hypothetical protein [Lactobacillus delbrueckii subsp. lactis]
MRKAVPMLDNNDQHPEMLEINKTDSERRELLRPFEIKSMQKATETVLCFDRFSFAIKT